MNNNKVDCDRLKTAFLKFEEILGNDGNDSPLWRWLFDSAIKCREYKMARKVIQKMPVRTRIEAMADLAIKSGKGEYIIETIELAWKEIEAGNSSGYLVLAEIIESMAKTGKEKAISKAIEEAEKIDNGVCKSGALNSIIKIVSEIKRRKAEALGCSASGDNEIREEIFSLTASETKALVAASGI